MSCSTSTMPRIRAAISTLAFALLLGSCGGQGGGLAPAGLTPQNAPSFGELSRLLDQEFARLGIDPQRSAAAVFAGGEDPRVFDLEVMALGPGTAENTFQVELSWTERLVGDYDGNGRVTVNDLTPIGINFGADVVYDPASQHQGFGGWPSGDPEDEGEGQANWQLAKVDGNADGVISVQDLTPIAIHWQQKLDGYRVYRQGPGDTEPVLVPNPLDGASPLTLPRQEGAPSPQRYRLILEEPCDGAFQYDYFVVPFSVDEEEEGDRSNGGFASFNGCEPMPVARVEANPRSGEVPLSVSFDATTSSDLDGSISSYEIDFGEGGGFEVMADGLAEHTYNIAGEFMVRTRVFDDSGLLDVSDAVVISALEPGSNRPPVASLESSNLSANAAPLEVSFDASASSDPEGDELSFAWDFGDGSSDTESGASVSHNYGANGAYEVRLTVSDGNGGSDSASVTVRIGNPPGAIVSATPLAGNAPLSVRFDASGSSDKSPGSIARYLWDWDSDGLVDLDSKTTAILNHDFTEPGDYLVRLTVEDDEGLVHSVDHSSDGLPLLVHVNAPPTVELSADPLEGDKDLLVSLSAEAADSDGVIADIEWDLDGDGIFSEADNGESLGRGESELQYLYTNEGAVTPAVRVSDDYGAFGSDDISISVTVNDPPVAVFSGGPLSGVTPVDASFDASESSDDHAVVLYEWDWNNDGLYDSSGIQPLAQHTFTAGGLHTVVLRVSDASGLTDTEQIELALDRWVHTWGSIQPESLSELVLDSAGNLYGAGGYTIDLQQDVLLVKFDRSGSLVWARRWGGLEDEHVTGACLDANGNLLICGDTKSFDDGLRGYIASFDPDGAVNWQAQWNTTDDISHVNGLCLHPSGDIIAAADRSDGGDKDAAVLRLDAAGNLVWQKYWAKASGTELFNAVTVDPDGNIYPVGSRFDDLSGPSLNALVTAFTADGTLNWDIQYDRANKADNASCVDYDPFSDNLIVGGSSALNNNLSSTDGLLMLVASNGTVNGRWTWGGSSEDSIGTVLFTSDGLIRVAGDSQDITGAPGIFVLGYDGNLGVQDLQLQYNDSGEASLGGLELDNAGNIHLSGTTTGLPGALTVFQGNSLTSRVGTVQSNVGGSGDITASFAAITGEAADLTGTLDGFHFSGSALMLRWAP